MMIPSHSIIASGPVIIEQNKVLLNREQKEYGISPWFFPGGEVEDFDISLEQACMREVYEEMGIEVKIIKPLKPILIKDKERVVILIHWLAERIGEIKPGNNIVDWNWFDLNNLPKNCAPNVYAVLNELN